MLSGIALGVVVVALCLVAVMILERDEGEKLFDTKRISNEKWEQAVLAGIAIALIVIFSTKAWWLAAICYVLMIGFDFVLLKWWHEEGSDFLEILPFIAISMVFYLILGIVAGDVARAVNNELISSILTTIPGVMIIVNIGYYVFEVFMFRARMEQ